MPLTTDIPGFVDSTISLINTIKQELTPEAEIQVIDYTSRLQMFTSESRRERSPIFQVIDKSSSFELRMLPKTGVHRKKYESSKELRDEVDSYLFSYFKTDTLGSNPLAKILRRRVSREAINVKREIENLLFEEHFCSAIVLNGRAGLEGAFRTATKQSKLSTFFWEQNLAQKKLFFCNHQSQDYFAISKELGAFVPDAAQIADAEKWLEARVNLRSEENLFSKHWNRSKTADSRKQISLSIFTSSQDEYWSLGPLLPAKDYDSPYDLYSTILGDLGPSDSCIIRLHPNTLNKSPGYSSRQIVKTLRLKRKFPNLCIVWPQEKLNSYDLVRSSCEVLVENSTIGAEAAWLGTPVTHLAHSPYTGLSELTLARGLSKSHVLNGKIVLAQSKEAAVRDVALKRSHYQVSFSVDFIQNWSKFRLIKSIKSPWALLSLSFHLAFPLVNRVLFATAKKIDFLLLSKRGLHPKIRSGHLPIGP